MACISCGRGLCEECRDSVGNSCCCAEERKRDPVSFGVDDSRLSGKRGPVKPDGEIGVSAGRKRAAVQYEIDPDLPCEWRGLANCGGGKHPIIGCLTGLQKHRHHGPVKHTARNEEGNVHRICANCHNLWHAKNDPIYLQSVYELLPHNPRPATPEEQLQRGKS